MLLLGITDVAVPRPFCSPGSLIQTYACRSTGRASEPFPWKQARGAGGGGAGLEVDELRRVPRGRGSAASPSFTCAFATRTIPRTMRRALTLAGLVVGAALFLAAAGSPRGIKERGADHRQLAVALPTWKLVYDHHDSRLPLSEFGAGLDVVTSERRTPRALVRRRPGSNTHYFPGEWSPNGAYLTYDGPGGLWVMDERGAGMKRLGSGRALNSLWSPDGTMVAVVVDCKRPPNGFLCRSGRPRIDLVDRDGARRRTLMTLAGPDRSAVIVLQDWSADGGLLYLVSGNGGVRLYSIGLDSASGRLLARGRHQGSLGGASWSPDGRLIAYGKDCKEGGGSGGGDVYCALAVLSAEGMPRRVLSRPDGRNGPTNDPEPGCRIRRKWSLSYGAATPRRESSMREPVRRDASRSGPSGA